MADLRLVITTDPSHAQAIKKLNWLPGGLAIERLDDVRADYDILIECTDAGQTLDAVSPGLRVGLIVRDALLLSKLLAQPRQADLLFLPNRLAVLDTQSLTRLTLKALTDLPPSHLLTKDDLALERNGSGLGVEMQAQVVGRRTAYALTAGSAIDFGILQ